ncbi:MAG: hypothetical protein WDN49_12495 [Acetobacteraceae bacterium]
MIASAPLVAIAVLVFNGAASAGPALLAALFVVLVAVLLAMLWTRDQDKMVEQVRRAAEGIQSAAQPMQLGPNAELMAEIERLIRMLSDRAAAASGGCGSRKASSKPCPTR